MLRTLAEAALFSGKRLNIVFENACSSAPVTVGPILSVTLVK
jgi:hypothetical protein